MHFVRLLVEVVNASVTTSIDISRIAANGTTVFTNETVTYEWMNDNLPSTGDGITHHGYQGPIFEAAFQLLRRPPRTRRRSSTPMLPVLCEGPPFLILPPWIMTGFVDDENSHVGNSYNKTLALEGDEITVVSDDGSEVSSNYIIAKSLNGSPHSGNIVLCIILSSGLTRLSLQRNEI